MNDMVSMEIDCNPYRLTKKCEVRVFLLWVAQKSVAELCL